MDKLNPVLQGLIGALLVFVLLTAMHVFFGTHPGDPLVYVFIGVLTAISGALTYFRARARLDGSTPVESILLKSWPRIVLTFLGLVAYSYAIGVLFVQEPGESPARSVSFGITLGAVIIIQMFRKSRQINDSFWKLTGIAMTVGVGSAVLVWAVQKLV